jgi:uncharacterized protein
VTDMLYIAAKAPRVGFAKTRLGDSIGHESAVALYKAFLRDLAARFTDAPFAYGWYVTPPGAWPEIAPLVAQRAKNRVLVQAEGDWTERQRDLFRGAAERGEEKVVLIASDSPHLTAEVVARAFDQLDRHELVLGPTHDGGYCLIGMRRPHDVLQGVLMSTGTELGDIIARAERAGLPVGLVEATFDVDEVEDLEYLRRLVATRADLAATRATLETLGLYEEGSRAVIDKVGSQTGVGESGRKPA